MLRAPSLISLFALPIRFAKTLNRRDAAVSYTHLDVYKRQALVEKSGAALWVHGHTHDSFDYHVGRTRVLANPRGYVKDGSAENAAFNPGLTVEVSDTI